MEKKVYSINYSYRDYGHLDYTSERQYNLFLEGCSKLHPLLDKFDPICVGGTSLDLIREGKLLRKSDFDFTIDYKYFDEVKSVCEKFLEDNKSGYYDELQVKPISHNQGYNYAEIGLYWGAGPGDFIGWSKILDCCFHKIIEIDNEKYIFNGLYPAYHLDIVYPLKKICSSNISTCKYNLPHNYEKIFETTYGNWRTRLDYHGFMALDHSNLCYDYRKPDGYSCIIDKNGKLKLTKNLLLWEEYIL